MTPNEATLRQTLEYHAGHPHPIHRFLMAQPDDRAFLTETLRLNGEGLNPYLHPADIAALMGAGITGIAVAALATGAETARLIEESPDRASLTAGAAALRPCSPTSSDGPPKIRGSSSASRRTCRRHPGP